MSYSPTSRTQKCGQLHLGLNRLQLSNTIMPTVRRKNAMRHQLILNFFIAMELKYLMGECSRKVLNETNF